jgi:hypothetical protein
VQGTGSLLVLGVVLALAGVAVLIRRRRWDAFWAYVVLGAAASVVPDAVTRERFHSLRAIGLPVFLVVLAIPAISFVESRLSSPRWRAVAAALVTLGLAQLALFQVDYWRNGPKRVAAFQATFPSVFRSAAATGRTVDVYLNDYEALGNAQWYGRLWNVPLRYLPGGVAAPAGDVVVAEIARCRRCPIIRRSGTFVAYFATNRP